MKVVSFARIIDDSGYIAEKSNNGGAYSFSTEFSLNNERELRLGIETVPTYNIWHGTSADFEFCHGCGTFGHDHEDCEKTATIEEVAKEISSCKGDVYVSKQEEIDIVVDPTEIEKVRRRIRDALNKTDSAVLLLRAANLFAVKV